MTKSQTSKSSSTTQGQHMTRHFEVRHGERISIVPMGEAQSLRCDVRELREALRFFMAYPNTHEAQHRAAEALRRTEDKWPHPSAQTPP